MAGPFFVPRQAGIRSQNAGGRRPGRIKTAPDTPRRPPEATRDGFAGTPMVWILPPIKTAQNGLQAVPAAPQGRNTPRQPQRAPRGGRRRNTGGCPPRRPEGPTKPGAKHSGAEGPPGPGRAPPQPQDRPRRVGTEDTPQGTAALSFRGGDCRDGLTSGRGRKPCGRGGPPSLRID